MKKGFLTDLSGRIAALPRFEKSLMGAFVVGSGAVLYLGLPTVAVLTVASACAGVGAVGNACRAEPLFVIGGPK